MLASLVFWLSVKLVSDRWLILVKDCDSNPSLSRTLKAAGVWWQAAGAIHTDFERGFICAEVMHYDELKELGTEAAVRAAGKYRQEVCSSALFIT